MVDINQTVSDLQRRVSNMIRRGSVHSVDLSRRPPRVKVEYLPSMVTNWLPYASDSASDGSVSESKPPSVGEGVVMVSESGDLNNAIVIARINNSENQAVSTSPDEHVTQYADGTKTTYNYKTSQLSVVVVGDISIESTKSTTIKADSLNLEAANAITLKGSEIHLN